MQYEEELRQLYILTLAKLKQVRSSSRATFPLAVRSDVRITKHGGRFEN